MPVVYYEWGCWEIGRSLIIVLFSKQLKSKVIGWKMLELILCALGLLIVQIMAHYPMNLQHVQFFINRHGEIEYSETTLRIQRAAANLKETLNILDLNDPGDGARC